MRKRIFDLLDAGERDDFAGRAVNTFLILLILGNVLAVIFESVESFRAQYAGAFLMFEIFSVAIFSVEYGLRLWSCVEDVTHRYPATWRGRLRYALSPMAVNTWLGSFPPEEQAAPIDTAMPARSSRISNSSASTGWPRPSAKRMLLVLGSRAAPAPFTTAPGQRARMPCSRGGADPSG